MTIDPRPCVLGGEPPRPFRRKPGRDLRPRVESELVEDVADMRRGRAVR